MNLKTALVGLASAVFAAGLTYWAVSPMRSGSATVGSAARMTAPASAGPPLVISKAEPEAAASTLPPAQPSGSKTARAKPSPAGEPITPPPAEAPVPSEAVVPAPVESAAPPDPQPQPVSPPAPAVASAPPPPEPVPLYPPKEMDRAQPAILRSRESNNGSAPNSTTISQGTIVVVRLGESLSSQKNITGDNFFATLDQPLVAGGFVIAEKGARAEGKIVEVDKGKGFNGASRISLELTQITTSDGQHIHVQTNTFTKDGGDRNHDHDAAKLGAGAILGAVIGAAAGGGKGAAIGAGAGAAAGGGAVLISGNRRLNIPVETKLTFRIEKPVTLTERVVQ